jgi:hypothetical protein
MIGKHMVVGDVVGVEHGKEPRPGDVAAALIDGQSTRRRSCSADGRFAGGESEIPRPDPRSGTAIQGVMVA